MTQPMPLCHENKVTSNVSSVAPDICVGCCSCSSVCPTGAIDIVCDDEGFYMPQVHEEKCVSCGMCISHCPLEGFQLSVARQVYAVSLCNTAIKVRSSSGGAFWWIASNVLSRDGVVYGAAFNSAARRVEHVRVSDVNELHLLQNSKYVQSLIGSCYVSVKDDLAMGRQVLFSGTPCQIAGLYSYLGRKHDGLYTCDILCYGVPSPLALKCFLEDIAKNEPIGAMNMRDKTVGWVDYCMRVELPAWTYLKGKNEDLYHLGFQSQMLYRRCCYECRFRHRERVGDLTLGDFWDFQESYRRGSIRNDGTGISYLSVNTDNGALLLSSMRFDEVTIEQRNAEENSSNLGFGVEMQIPEHRNDFFSALKDKGYIRSIQPYVTPVIARRVSPIRKLYRIMKQSYHFRALLHRMGIPT